MKSWSALSESVIGLFGIHIISQYTDYGCLTVQDNFFMQRENISVKEFSSFIISIANCRKPNKEYFFEAG